MRQRIRQPLLLMIVTLAISIMFYITQLFYTSSVNGRSSRIYEQSMVAAINQFEYLPDLLAHDQTLRDVIIDPSRNHLTASQKLQFIAKRSGSDALYLMDTEGNVKAASNYDQSNGGFLNRNYGFRPYFTRALSERTRQFYYAKGATTGIPGFFISAPILERNKPIGVAVVKLDLRHWEKKWYESGENIVVGDENNVIILSSVDHWRYRSIGLIPNHVKEKINQQQQFIGSEHLSLFSKSINLSFYDKADSAFWIIDNKLFLVNSFNIPETDWKLYYLVKHDAILASALVFFSVISILAIMAYFIIVGRRHIVESKKKNRLLELKRREELQTVMDNIRTGVILFSNTGELLSANDHAVHLLIEKPNSEKDSPIYIHELIDIDNHHFDQLLTEETAAPAYHETNVIRRNKPPIPVMFAVSKVNTFDQEAYLMTLINITRRKAAEIEIIKINERLEEMVENRTRQLQETQEQLIQKNKAAALGNMAATIVHELSQPLTAMNSSIAAINAKINNNDWEGVKQSASRIAPLTNKMYSVIKLLKFFSYQDKKSYEVININQTIKQSIDSLLDILKDKSIDATITLSDDEVFVDANPLKIDLIISNIIQNAIDALEKVSQPKITITTRWQNQWSIIEITDNAGGIDKKIMKKMFSPYFTTKEVGKGLGLGLAISYEIVQEYNGKIKVENHPDGACFIVMLPTCRNYPLVVET